jgi:hypothetical protein
MTEDTPPMTRQALLRKAGLAALLAPIALVAGCAQPTPPAAAPAPPPPAPPPPAPPPRARG